MIRRVLTTTALLLLTIVAAIVFGIVAIDEEVTADEAQALADGFAGLGPAAGNAGELVERPEGLPVGVSGATEVYCDEEGYRVLRTLDDGNVVQLARVELRWAPGSVPLTVLTLALLLAVAAAVVLALPLILRVRRLEQVTAAIADGDLGIRAPESEGDELGKLGRHINEMTSQVATHIGTQEALLHAIAHEYRTPLTSARFALSILGDCVDDADRDRQLARLGVALDELEELADKVLVYAKAGAFEASGESIAFGELAHGLQTVAPTGPRLSFEGERGLLLAGDPQLIRWVARNLLGNALRHANTRVHVAAMERADGVVVTVDDDGPGIPVADRENVFLPFHRLDESRSRGSGAHGLGLAIVSRFAATLGGSCWVEDSPLGGARFLLRLPAAEGAGTEGSGAQGLDA